MYSKLKCKELKKILKTRNLKTNGKKQQLILRLKENDESQRKKWDPNIINTKINLPPLPTQETYTHLCSRYLTTRDCRQIKNLKFKLLNLVKNATYYGEYYTHGCGYDIFLNTDIFKYMIQYNIKFPDIFFQLVYSKKQSNNFRYENHFTSNVELELFEHERLSTQMYDYQIKNLLWMLKLEKNIEIPYVKYNKKIKHIFDNYYYDVNLNKIRQINDINILESKRTVISKGGILADEMGLGKSLICLSLILANPSPINQIHTKLNLDVQEKYPCRSTLIFCPNHLIKQWYEEIVKHINPTFRVVTITTKSQHAKTTYLDILRSDIVLVSYNFLLNPNYVYLKSHTNLSDLQINNTPENIKKPVFDHFNWHRIIIDEGHELLDLRGNYSFKNINIFKIIKELDAEHKWYVTGTPFPSGYDSFRCVCDYLEIPVNEINNPNEFIKHIYRRNTKKIVKSECVLPKINEHNMILEMTDVEKALYETAKLTRSDLRLRQLCSHMQISEHDRHILGSQPKTMEEIKNLMIVSKETELKHETKKLQNCDKLLNSYVQQKEDGLIDEDLNKNISKTRTKIKLTNAKITKIKNSLSFFKSILPKIQNKTEKCPICFDTIEDIGITDCGHIFCYSCILNSSKYKKQCPNCRKKYKNIFHYTEQLKQINTDLENLINQYGTKLGNLVNHLNSLKSKEPKFKAIIFSQWDSLLSLVSNVLDKNNINNLNCKGSIFIKNNVLKKFKEDENFNILMLSSTNAASGINLTHATHIIFLDLVFAETKEKTRLIEEQAIGRAHRIGQTKEITVTRMIMKNTIEEELWNKRRVVI